MPLLVQRAWRVNKSLKKHFQKNPFRPLSDSREIFVFCLTKGITQQNIVDTLFFLHVYLMQLYVGGRKSRGKSTAEGRDAGGQSLNYGHNLHLWLDVMSVWIDTITSWARTPRSADEQTVYSVREPPGFTRSLHFSLHMGCLLLNYQTPNKLQGVRDERGGEEQADTRVWRRREVGKERQTIIIKQMRTRRGGQNKWRREGVSRLIVWMR